MNPDTPPILVLSRKKPHLVFVLLLCSASGLSAFLVEADTRGVPADEIAEWLAITRVWGGFLLFTGSVSLVAHLQRWDRERGMYVERGALTMQAGGVLAYAVCLPVFLGWTAAVILSLVVAGAWAWANLWEVKLIGADLKLISIARRLTPRSEDDSPSPE